jgi:Xaa-Pro aminopeptidase
VLHIQEVDETVTKMEQEILRIVQAALPFAQPDPAARDIVLDIVRYLPARTEHEVTYVLELAEGTQDNDVQSACAEALSYSLPVADEAWAVLERAHSSSIDVIRKAVEERLKQRKDEMERNKGK